MAFEKLVSSISESVNEFTQNLAHFKELGGLRTRWEEGSLPSPNPELQKPREIVVLRAYTDYLSLFKRFASLTPEEVSTLDIANNKKNLQRVQNSKIEKPGAADLHEALGGNMEIINEFINESADTKSETFSAAKQNLVDMMNNAQKIKEAVTLKLKEGGNMDPQHSEIIKELEKTFVDGNQDIYRVPGDTREYKVDNAIWGYIQVTDPEAQLHFLMAHFFERFVTQKLSSSVELSHHKDYLLNTFTDVLLLDAARDSLSPSEKRLYDVWKKPRKENGALVGNLGWINEDYKSLYKNL